MTFPYPPFPLAQSTELQVGETLAISAGIDTDDTCYESGDTFIEVHDFDATIIRKDTSNNIRNISYKPIQSKQIFLIQV